MDNKKSKPLSKLIPGLLLATAVFWVPAIIFVILANEVMEQTPLYGDVGILLWIHQFAGPVLDKFVIAITTLGNAEVVVPGVLLAIIALILRNYRRKALFLFFTAGSTALINYLFKLMFQRDRPALWDRIIIEHGYSFPSGHAMMSSALALSGILLFWNTKYRVAVTVISTLYFLLVGFSRMYLGVHYPSDILGGWMVSLLWVFFVHKVFILYGKPIAIK